MPRTNLQAKMLRILFRNKVLFSGYLLFLTFSSIPLLVLGKKETHLLFSGLHTPFLDVLMKLSTWLGDGLFMVLAGIALLFVRMRYGFIVLSSFLASSLIVQLLKRLVFPGFKRPVAWFQEIGIELYRIGGVEYHSYFSFPSGHSATAFALFFGLAFMVKTEASKILFLFLAILTGFSRVYLSQHFLGDVLAGSMLGILIALLAHALFVSCKREWMDKGAINLLSKK